MAHGIATIRFDYLLDCNRDWLNAVISSVNALPRLLDQIDAMERELANAMEYVPPDARWGIEAVKAYETKEAEDD